MTAASGESLLDKISEKLHGHDSSSDSDSEKPVISSVKDKAFRLFGREKPVHSVLGGGKRMNLCLSKHTLFTCGLVEICDCRKVYFECNIFFS